ncbi:MAG: hypothetical protein NVS4B12_19140 [Ktedonobacteraceae bacterium]
MNIAEQLEDAHLLVIQTVDNLPELEWDIPTASGNWSVKDIVAHLTSYEHILVDVFHIFLEESPNTPYLAQFIEHNADFNQVQVGERSSHTAQQVIDEFEEAQVEVTSLLARIPSEIVEKKGTLSWYKDCSLSDFISTLTGHMKRHCEEIMAFRNRQKQ